LEYSRPFHSEIRIETFKVCSIVPIPAPIPDHSIQKLGLKHSILYLINAIDNNSRPFHSEIRIETILLNKLFNV